MNKNWVAIDTINGSLDYHTEYLKGNNDPKLYTVEETKELIGKVSLAIRQLGNLNAVLIENFCNDFLERVTDESFTSK